MRLHDNWLGLTAALVLIGGVVGLASAKADGGPGARACHRIESLCTSEVLEADHCIDEVDRARPREVMDLDRCVQPAQTCGEVIACLSTGVTHHTEPGLLGG